MKKYILKYNEISFYSTLLGHPIIEVVIEDEIIDLHNAGEFLGQFFNPLDSSILLWWKIYFEDTEAYLFLSFKNVSKFEVICDHCFNKIYDQNEETVIERIRIDDSVLTFEFESERVIRIIAENANAELLIESEATLKLGKTFMGQIR